MNKEELEQIKKELDEVSKWPWVHRSDGWSDIIHNHDKDIIEAHMYGLEASFEMEKQDAEFIAKAPERIVALVKRIEELEDEQTKAN